MPAQNNKITLSTGKKIRLKKCKTCEGCKALQDVQGYGLSCGVIDFHCSKDGIPDRPCPKPKTYQEWVDSGYH